MLNNCCTWHPYKRHAELYAWPWRKPLRTYLYKIHQNTFVILSLNVKVSICSLTPTQSRNFLKCLKLLNLFTYVSDSQDDYCEDEENIEFDWLIPHDPEKVLPETGFCPYSVATYLCPFHTSLWSFPFHSHCPSSSGWIPNTRRCYHIPVNMLHCVKNYMNITLFIMMYHTSSNM